MLTLFILYHEKVAMYEASCADAKLLEAHVGQKVRRTNGNRETIGKSSTDRHCCGGAETLGGNCVTTVIGTVRQGEWDKSLATLKHLVAARQVCSLIHLHSA